MLNDFVTGALTCDRAKAIIWLEKLVKAAREKGVYVIYANDAHIKGVDRELQLWGDHAIIGTGGAEVIPELTPQEGDFVVPKRRYSGFFQTDLHLLLTEAGRGYGHHDGPARAYVRAAHGGGCVLLGYGIIVPTDATDSFTKEDYEYGIRYLKDIYGAQLTTVDELVETF